MRPRGSPRGIAAGPLLTCSLSCSFNEAAGKSPRNPEDVTGASAVVFVLQ